MPECTACKSTLKPVKDLFMPDGWKIEVCAECRVKLDAGVPLARLAPRPERPSRMKKQMDRAESEAAAEAAIPPRTSKYEVDHSVAAQQPFPASWRKPRTPAEVDKIMERFEVDPEMSKIVGEDVGRLKSA